MRILIDIGHPAHVHYFRNMTNDLENKGHSVLWAIKDIDIVKYLLNYYGLEYIILTKKSDGLHLKIMNQLRHDLLLFSMCKKENVDLIIGSTIAVAHVSKTLKLKSILFDDDDDVVQPLVSKFVKPFSDVILSPDVLPARSKQVVLYPGYQELAYLHPKRFIPEISVLSELGLTTEETFFVMRFNAFKAHHDIGVKGLSLCQKLTLVELLQKYGKVFITSERSIEPELEGFKITLAPHKIHSLLAFATMFIGDSQTMTSESAILGVPALKCNTFAGKLSVPNELENRYNLCYSFLPGDFNKMVEKISELLGNSDIKKLWQNRRKTMLNDKIDVSSFFTWFIDNYPESFNIVKLQPEKIYSFV